MTTRLQSFAGAGKRRQLSTWLSSTATMAALLATGSCGSTPAEPSTGDRIPFIAYARDFNGFRTWTSNTIDSPPAATTHVGGLRTIYINQLPAPDAATFALGTMIVKETADGKLFARAKRGGGYNVTGAVDWEWFELEEKAAGVVVRWHGFGPPLGEMYGGDAKGGCNLCHKAVPANDYVLAAWLTLGGTAVPVDPTVVPTAVPADPTVVPDAGTPAPVTGAEPDAGVVDAVAEETAVVP